MSKLILIKVADTVDLSMLNPDDAVTVTKTATVINGTVLMADGRIANDVTNNVTQEVFEAHTHPQSGGLTGPPVIS